MKGSPGPKGHKGEPGEKVENIMCTPGAIYMCIWSAFKGVAGR